MLGDTLDWPWFTDDHRRYATKLVRWAEQNLTHLPHDDVDQACRARVRLLGEAGFLKAAVPKPYGGLYDALDVRTLCLSREILGFHDGLADFAFAMQGLGTGAITLFGSEALKERYLRAVAAGNAIAAFALSEPEAGSDVAALAMTARPDGNDHVRLDGRKTWISNGGIADFYVVFARTGEGPGAKGLSAFVVDADTPGLSIAERIEVIAPHPLATLAFDRARVPVENRLGQPGEGFKVAMATLDIFRSTVGAAALGFARRALAETVDAPQPENCLAPAGGVAALAGRHRRQRNRSRCRRSAGLSCRLDQGHWRGPGHAGSRHGQDVCDRSRAAGDRSRGADIRRPRSHEGREGRGTLSRDPRAADLRRRN